MLSTVYPISEKVLTNFRKELNKNYGNGQNQNKVVYAGTSLAQVGNYREIQKIDKHNVMYVSSGPDAGKDIPKSNN